MKALLKLAFLVLLGSAVAGVVMITKRPSVNRPVSYDSWPEVPRKTEQ
jgi:hypothetical protein